MRAALRELLFTEDKLYPPRLGNLAAWYDALDPVTMLAINGTQITDGGAVALWGDKSGNSGVNCLVLPGTAANYAQVPDALALDLGTAFQFDVDARANDWTPSALQNFLGRWAAAKRAYTLGVNTNGTLFCNITTDGDIATLATWTSTDPIGFADYARGQVRFRRDGTLGQFYKSTNGTDWTQVGTDVTGSTALAPFATDIELRIGENSGAGFFAGKIFSVKVYSDAGTTVAYNIDFSTIGKKLANGDTFVCATGQTVTLNSSGATGARIAGERDLFQGTLANRPVYLNFAGTKYAYFAGIAGFTVSVPLANDTYDVAITYKGGTTDTSTVVVGAGVAAFGGTDVKFASKMVTRIVVSKSSVAQATFDPSLYTSGTSFTSSDGLTWTINGGAHIVTRTGLYFDGSNDYLKTAAFSLRQPETVYLCGDQVTWTLNDALHDGSAQDTMELFQVGSPNGLRLYAGSSVAQNVDLPLKTRGIIASLFNGASSQLRINRGSATTGNPGAANGNGVTVGALATGSNAANTFVSEVAIYSAAHATATQDRMALYAGRKWGFAA